MPFCYDPRRVPSLRVNGVREPICLACVTRANPVRVRNGLPEIVPLPGAYDACDESEMQQGE